MRVKERDTIGKFEKDKIVDSLVNEVNMAKSDAKRIASRIEAELNKLSLDDISTTQIRSLVAALLLKEGFTDQATFYERLGIPQVEIDNLLNGQHFDSGDYSPRYSNPSTIFREAGRELMKQYSLRLLPSSIADAHLASDIHIHYLPAFSIRINSVCHDWRLFLEHGLSMDSRGIRGMSSKPPKSAEDAFSQALSIARETQSYVTTGQSFDSLNTLFAPFLIGKSYASIKEFAKSMIYELSQGLLAGKDFPLMTLTFDVGPNKSLSDLPAIGPSTGIGNYSDHVTEADSFLRAFLEVLLEKDYFGKCFYQPQIVLKVHDKSTQGDIMDLAANLVASQGILYFAKADGDASYLADGSFLRRRSGSLQTVSLNLPRIAIEAKGDDKKLFEILEQKTQLALQAIHIKEELIKKVANQGLFNFLLQEFSGEPYVDLSGLSKSVGVIGLTEMAKAHTGMDMHESDSAFKFAKKVLSFIDKQVSEAGPNFGVVQTSNFSTSMRFARSDERKYGFDTIPAAGSAELPFYSASTFLSQTANVPLAERVKTEGQLHNIARNGHLLDVHLSEEKPSVSSIKQVLNEVFDKSDVKFFTLTQNHSVCRKCRKSFFGFSKVCVNCGSDQTEFFSRVGGIYQHIKELEPSESWHLYSP